MVLDSADYQKPLLHSELAESSLKRTGLPSLSFAFFLDDDDDDDLISLSFEGRISIWICYICKWWVGMIEFLWRKCVDCCGAHNNRGDRVRVIVSGMELGTTWLDCRSFGYAIICFSHSSCYISSMQLLQNSWPWIWSRQESLLPWCCWSEFRYEFVSQLISPFSNDWFDKA